LSIDIDFEETEGSDK